jgi:type II secretory pathway pseudopilin PulG
MTNDRRNPRPMTPRRSGMTLLELGIVAVILVALASIALPMFSGVTDNSRVASTYASLRQLQDVIMNRYVPDMKGMLGGTYDDGLPRPQVAGVAGTQPHLRYLFVNPIYESVTPKFDPLVQRGWNGPYLVAGQATYPDPTLSTNSARGFDATYGSLGDPTVFDGWGNPIVIMLATNGTNVTGAFLVSAGANGTLDTTSTYLGSLLANSPAVSSTTNVDDQIVRLNLNSYAN